MAKCNRCKNIMNIEKFTKPDGKILKTCEGCRDSRKAYYKANQEEIKVRNKAYRQCHQEKVKSRNKDYRQAHKEEYKAFQKAYRDSHKEKKASYSKAYFKSHVEKFKAYSKTYDKTPGGRKTRLTSSWRCQGIIFHDVETFYKRYISATNCEHCSVEFLNSRDRNADHDHAITDAPNIRGILCRRCNLRDVLKDYFTNE